MENQHGESCIISTKAGRASALLALSRPVEGIQICHSGASSGVKTGLRLGVQEGRCPGVGRGPGEAWVCAVIADPGSFGLGDSRFVVASLSLQTLIAHANRRIRIITDAIKDSTILEQGLRPIYLDMQSTTPVDPRVLDAMLPFYVGEYGNPHSRTHAYGWDSEKAVEAAREHVASLIGADPKEIIFTSGATESNNMSIKGVARFFKKSGKKNHIITTQTEHKCVLDSCRHLQDEGIDVTYLPVQPSGLIKMEDLEAAIRPETCLVSIMAVNNEIGVIQPLEEIGKLCRKHKVFFHTDGAQAVGKIPMDVNAMNVDLMSISSHKVYGPKGMGACYVRRRPRVRLDPLITGGGQERGLRSGTLAPPLIVGFGEACRISKEEMEVSFTHRTLRLHSFSFFTMMICYTCMAF